MIPIQMTMPGVARPPQAGLTLIELMVSLTLGIVIILAATSLFLSSKSAFVAIDEGIRVQDSGRYALELIARTVQQAGYINWDSADAGISAERTGSADILGFDARSLKSTMPDIQSPLRKAVNGSDVLAIRFSGSGAGNGGDGTVLNCGGFGVGIPAVSAPGVDARGWSIFYVAQDSTGEPELRCKYQGKSSWRSDAIVRGVESFQVLYGLDSDADGMPNQFVSADAIAALDGKIVLNGVDDAAKSLERNRKTHWKKVVAIKVALLIRGTQNSRVDAMRKQEDLFGADYSLLHAATDIGTRIDEKNIVNGLRNRTRKVFQKTITLRNAVAASDA